MKNARHHRPTSVTGAAPAGIRRLAGASIVPAGARSPAPALAGRDLKTTEAPTTACARAAGASQTTGA